MSNESFIDLVVIFSMHINYSMKWNTRWSISKAKVYAFKLRATFHR